MKDLETTSLNDPTFSSLNDLDFLCDDNILLGILGIPPIQKQQPVSVLVLEQEEREETLRRDEEKVRTQLKKQESKREELDKREKDLNEKAARLKQKEERLNAKQEKLAELKKVQTRWFYSLEKREKTLKQQQGASLNAVEKPVEKPILDFKAHLARDLLNKRKRDESDSSVGSSSKAAYIAPCEQPLTTPNFDPQAAPTSALDFSTAFQLLFGMNRA